jgi:hypothetical protein
VVATPLRLVRKVRRERLSRRALAVILAAASALAYATVRPIGIGRNAPCDVASIVIGSWPWSSRIGLVSSLVPMLPGTCARGKPSPLRGRSGTPERTCRRPFPFFLRHLSQRGSLPCARCLWPYCCECFLCSSPAVTPARPAGLNPEVYLFGGSSQVPDHPK